MDPILFFLSACGPKEKIEEVNYRLKWLYNVSSVGDLYADANGNFSRNGLKVNVKPGGPERDALKELELGHAQFGVASADQVLRAAAKGAPIVVLAQLFQVNPLHWIYRPDRTLFTTPAGPERQERSASPLAATTRPFCGLSSPATASPKTR